MFPYISRTVRLTAAILVALAVASPTRGFAADTAATTPTSSCGDGLLGKDETCQSCAADCQPSACKTTGHRKVTIELTPQTGYETIGAVTVLVAYRKGVLSLPGEKSAPAAKARVKARQADAQVFVNDLGYALRAVVSSKAGLPAGPLLDLNLDACAGAPAAQVADLSCTVESCAQGGGRLNSCACSVSLP